MVPVPANYAPSWEMVLLTADEFQQGMWSGGWRTVPACRLRPSQEMVTADEFQQGMWSGDWWMPVPPPSHLACRWSR